MANRVADEERVISSRRLSMRRARVFRLLLAGTTLGASMVTSPVVFAQAGSRWPAPGATAKPRQMGNVEQAKAPGVLGRRFGVSGALEIGGSRAGEPDPSLEERRRALLRLASLGTPESLDAVRSAWETDPHVARDPTTRLAVARALRKSAGEKGIRELLAGMVMLANDPPDDVTAAAATAAAFSLAEAHDPEATDFLLALAQENEGAATLARAALHEHPPSALPSAIGPRSAATPTPALVRLAVALGDVRAIPFLRRAVRDAEPEVRLGALKALAELGDGEAVPIARGWVGETEAAPRLAALAVLVRGAPKEAVGPLSRALAEPSSRGVALALAAESGEDGVFPALAPLATNADPAVRVGALHALGKLLDRRAPAVLVAGLGDPETGLSAVAALARSRSPEVASALAAAIARPTTREPAVRAAVARWVATREKVSGLDEAIAALESDGATAGAIAIATWANAVFGRLPAALTRAGRVQGHDDVEVEEARLGLDALGRSVTLPSVMAGVLARWATGGDFGDDDRRGLALLLETGGDRVDPVALTLLIDPAMADAVPSLRLLAWLERGGAGAPLAALALASRDEADHGARLARFQRSPDAQLRAHVALGLGRSPHPDAAARLAKAFDSERDENVRRAIVTALGSPARRDAPIARRTLELAAHLDVAPRVRHAAAAALQSPSRSVIGDGFRGRETSFVHVPSSKLSEASWRFQAPSGLVVPVRADGAGVVVVAGLPSGVSQLSLAATTLELPEGSP